MDLSLMVQGMEKKVLWYVAIGSPRAGVAWRRIVNFSIPSISEDLLDHLFRRLRALSPRPCLFLQLA
jgi:hypothetical protein